MSSSDSDETPNISFITTNKNKRLLVIDGYMYHQNKITEKVTYWKCNEKLCWAGIHLNSDDSFIKYTKTQHNHMPTPERLEIRKMMMNIKARVTHETTAVGQIYTEELARADLSTNALAIAHTAKEANHGLHQTRRQTTPILPDCMDFDIPPRYKKTINGKRFLLADRIRRIDGDPEKRIIVYATDDQLRLLFSSPHIMMDGTFDSCPPHFDQVYSIHALKNNQSFLCVIALLCGRSNVIYKELFSILTRHAHRLKMKFHPTKLTSDFELALIKTVMEEFPNVHHIGCYFHFTNAVYRQIQNLRLTNIYRDDQHARSTARKLMALPLIPLNHIQEAFDTIENEAPDSMTPLIDYIDGYWITKVRWSLWNVSDAEFRTNNMVEGWNHRFNRLVSKYHPNIWHFLGCVQKEEVCVRQQMLKVSMGESKKINKKTADFQRRIQSLQSQFEEKKIRIDELLEGLSLLVGAHS